MKWSEFEQKFLVACYLVAEETSEEIINTSNVFSRFDIPFKNGWVRRTIDGFVQNGMANETRASGSDENRQDVWLTSEGLRAAARIEDNVLLVEKGSDGLVGAEAASGLSAEANSPAEASQGGTDLLAMITNGMLTTAGKGNIGEPRIDSTAWTGPKLVLTDLNIIQKVRVDAKELRDKVYSTHFESNSDSQDLQKLADALVAVCDMAEPDLTVLDRILAHPKFKIYAALLTGAAAIRGAIGF